MPGSLTDTDSLDSFFQTKAQTTYQLFNRGQQVGLVIPIYQRSYSWDTENIDKLMEDLLSGIKRQSAAPNREILFLGTVIVCRVSVDDYIDDYEVVREAFAIIDGQQRLTTLTLLAIALSERLTHWVERIVDQGWDKHPEFRDLVKRIHSRLTDLRTLFTIISSTGGAQPPEKPLIIRHNPQSLGSGDQWTFDGRPEHHYHSDIASYVNDYVLKTSKVETFPATDRRISSRPLRDAIERLRECINNIAESKEGVSDYLDVQSLNGHTLTNDLDMDLIGVAKLGGNSVGLAEEGIRLLAFANFTSHLCGFVQITTTNERIGLDIFQSLNGTGTRLTAFEVFEPHVVIEMGAPTYSSSDVAGHFSNIAALLDNEDAKVDLTDEIILKASIAHDGEKVEKRYSRQRDWLTSAFDQLSSRSEQVAFITWLHHVTEYWCKLGHIPRLPNRGTKRTEFPLFKSLHDYLSTAGLPDNEIDTAALCLYVVRRTGHTIVHSVLSVFFSKMLSSQNNPTMFKNAASDFVSACRSCVAFILFFRGALDDYPDDEVRQLFVDKNNNFSWVTDRSNQHVSYLRNYFKDILSRKKAYDKGNSANAKKLWVDKAIIGLNYEKNQQLCMFALHVAAHNQVPDMNAGNEGLTTQGRNPNAEYLTCERYFSTDTRTIEHVADQEQPKTLHFPNEMDYSLYPPNNKVVHQLGNLTMLPTSANSSTYKEWPNKLMYYVSLTQESEVRPFDLTKIQSKLGATRIPPALESVVSSSSYQPHLAPIAFRGYDTQGKGWTKAFVDRRTKHMCQIIFDELDQWL